MSRTLLAAAGLALALVSSADVAGAAPKKAPPAKDAAPQGPPTLVSLIKPFLIAKDQSVGDWTKLDANKAVTWGPGPSMQDKPSPDGNFFVRPGRGQIDGRALDVLATGARSGVFSVYIRDPGAMADAAATAGAFKQAGYTVSLARCPINPQLAAARRWLKLTAPGKKPAFLAVGPLNSGGAGYTLYLADDTLAALTPKEQAVYTDSCPAL
jgi:hypothetical protein